MSHLCLLICRVDDADETVMTELARVDRYCWVVLMYLKSFRLWSWSGSDWGCSGQI